MNREDYTSDTICREMNLPGFIEAPWVEAESPTLRVVLTPSFHPELCITVARGPKATLVSVVALAEHLWIQQTAVRLHSNREQVQLPLNVFEEVIDLCRAAHTGFDPNRQGICCDGMGSESCLVSRASTQRLRAHVNEHKATGLFVARLIELAWNNCRTARIRNALAHAAAYLGIKYPLEVLPGEKPITRLGILGTPEAREDYFRMIDTLPKDGQHLRNKP